jgi:polar amino acid transport system substrate-binding protein
MRAAVLFLTALLGLPAAIQAAEPPREIVIGTFPIADDPMFVICRKVLEEAYRRIGIKMNLATMPGERSLILANSGKTDGDLCRTKGALSGYANLLMVGPPLTRAEVVAFSKTALPINNWEDLSRYEIGYERGVKVVEQNTLGMNVDIASNAESGYKKLLIGRTDVYVDTRISGLYMLRRLGYPRPHVSPPLETFTMHHFVNVKNAALIGKLSEALEQMQKEGAIARIERSVTGQ